MRFLFLFGLWEQKKEKEEENKNIIKLGISQKGGKKMSFLFLLRVNYILLSS